MCSECSGGGEMLRRRGSFYSVPCPRGRQQGPVAVCVSVLTRVAVTPNGDSMPSGWLRLPDKSTLRSREGPDWLCFAGPRLRAVVGIAAESRQRGYLWGADARVATYLHLLLAVAINWGALDELGLFAMTQCVTCRWCLSWLFD